MGQGDCAVWGDCFRQVVAYWQVPTGSRKKARFEEKNPQSIAPGLEFPLNLLILPVQPCLPSEFSAACQGQSILRL
jgi:hypothetical protein